MIPLPQGLIWIALIRLDLLAPISDRRILPDDGGDDPTIPCDVALSEVESDVADAVKEQQHFQSEVEGATLEREARIELQNQTGEAFPSGDDDVGPALDDSDASGQANMDVDDSATSVAPTSVAPTEAVNPAYVLNPPPTKLPRTGSASAARKLFFGPVMHSDSSTLSDSAPGDDTPVTHVSPPQKARPTGATRRDSPGPASSSDIPSPPPKPVQKQLRQQQQQQQQRAANLARMHAASTPPNTATPHDLPPPL